MLTEGAILKICQFELVNDSGVKPVVQVTDMKIVRTAADRVQRYMMVLSDGAHSQQGMLATQLNHLIDSGSLRLGSILRLEKFVCSYVKDRQIIIVADLEVIQCLHDLIGKSEMLMIPAPNAPGPSNPFHLTSGVGLDQGRYPASNTPLVYPKPDSTPPISGQFNSSSSNADYPNYPGDVASPLVNNSVQQPQPANQPPQQKYMNRGSIERNEAPPRIIPISALNPYQGRWTIKVRVTVKSEVRFYNNARGDGRVFSFDLLDSDGGEIRVTCFNAVVDQFFNKIETGKVYMISGGRLNPAQKNFNHLQNEYVIVLNTSSVVQPCFEDDSSIPKPQFRFHRIGEVQGMNINSIVDVIGVAFGVSPETSVMTKNGSETLMRTLYLKDDSGRGIEFTMWGGFCKKEGQRLEYLCNTGESPVLAVRSGRVNDFNGKVLGTIPSTQVFVEPDIPEAQKLSDWFQREGKDASISLLSRNVIIGGNSAAWKPIFNIKDIKLGTSGKPDCITVCATVSFIKVDNFCYPACPILVGDRKCNEKVTSNGDGKWRCDRCDRYVNECDYKYILKLQIQDHTSLTWVTAFQELGEEIMGLPAKDLFCLITDSDSDNVKFKEVIRKVLFTKFVFKLKLKEEMFNDERRVKAMVISVSRVNFSSGARFLLNSLKRNVTDGASSSSVTPHDAFPSRSGVSNGLSSVISGGYHSQSDQTVRYGNQSGSSLPGTNNILNVQMSCTICGKSGHNSSNCTVMYGPGRSSTRGGGTNICYKCHRSGHRAEDCP